MAKLRAPQDERIDSAFGAGRSFPHDRLDCRQDRKPRPAASRTTRCCAGKAASATMSRRKARSPPALCARRMVLRGSSASTRARRSPRPAWSRSTRPPIWPRRIIIRSRIAHPIPGRGGKVAVSPHRPALAGDRVMHVGEPVAMVVAKTIGQAQDAAETVLVDYAALDAVTDAREAVKPGAPQLWPEAPGNIGFDWTAPVDPDGKKQAALERAFKDAAHVVRVELTNQRLVVAALEPRSATASYDAAGQDLHVALPVAIGGRHARAACRLAQRQAGGVARLDRRRRRRLRHERRGASGICRAAARRARAWAAGALALDPLGSLSVRCARPRLVLDGRARAQRARPFPWPARELPRQYGRLYHAGRAFHRHHAYLRLPADRLRYPACAGEHALRLHQHGADRALSRRRPPGSGLSDRARGRRRRRSIGHRRRRTAPAQFDRAGADALHHRLRQHL